MFLSQVKVSRSVLPVVNIVDTSLDIKQSLYLINASNKNFKSMLFFLRLLVKDRFLVKRLQKVFFRRFLLYVL